jgi:peptidoglycan hydrolase CwlO-like protein
VATFTTDPPDPYAPTAELISERDQLRAEVQRLTDAADHRGRELDNLRAEVQVMANAFTQAHLEREAAKDAAAVAKLAAEGQAREVRRVRDENAQLRKSRFTEGFRGAVRSVRDHFVKLHRADVVNEIEKIWRPEKAETP